jgi:hypothetical protein
MEPCRRLAALLPGDRFVDWLGMDGYNWGTTRSWSRWQSFRDIFGPVYSKYSRRKPTMICEVASAQSGGDKAAWIRDMGAELAGPFSRVRALVWFHADKETDWRIDSSPASLAAFRSVPRHAARPHRATRAGISQGAHRSG